MCFFVTAHLRGCMVFVLLATSPFSQTFMLYMCFKIVTNLYVFCCEWTQELLNGVCGISNIFFILYIHHLKML
jgi:hypothetical protein